MLQVKQLKKWLLEWNEQKQKIGKKVKGKKQNEMAKKAVLLSRPHGIGKTTSAKLVTHNLGFHPLEFNASDCRGKADCEIENGINGRTSNSIKELVNERVLKKKGSPHQNKTVLIMDEVDGMSSGDRGGIADLIANIKISKIPIICICNDHNSRKLKSLVNHCLLLHYLKPTKEQFELEKLAERFGGDVRFAINQLEFMMQTEPHTDGFNQHLQICSKSEDISPFRAVDKLFAFNGGELRMDEGMDLCMSDPDLVPLIIQENYINYRPS